MLSSVKKRKRKGRYGLGKYYEIVTTTLEPHRCHEMGKKDKTEQIKKMSRIYITS